MNASLPPSSDMENRFSDQPDSTPPAVERPKGTGSLPRLEQDEYAMAEPSVDIAASRADMDTTLPPFAPDAPSTRVGERGDVDEVVELPDPVARDLSPEFEPPASEATEFDQSDYDAPMFEAPAFSDPVLAPEEMRAYADEDDADALPPEPLSDVEVLAELSLADDVQSAMIEDEIDSALAADVPEPASSVLTPVAPVAEPPPLATPFAGFAPATPRAKAASPVVGFGTWGKPEPAPLPVVGFGTWGAPPPPPVRVGDRAQSAQIAFVPEVSEGTEKNTSTGATAGIATNLATVATLEAPAAGQQRARILPEITPVETPEQIAERKAHAEAMHAFEGLTIVEMLGQMRRAPRETFGYLGRVLTTPPEVPVSLTAPVDSPDKRKRAGEQNAARRASASMVASSGARAVPLPLPGVGQLAPEERANETATEVATPDQTFAPETAPALTPVQEWIVLGLRLGGFGLAAFGTFVMQTSRDRTDAGGLAQGMPFLAIGLIVWIFSEVLQSLFAPKAQRQLALAGDADELPNVRPPTPRSFVSLLARGMWVAASGTCALFAATLNSDPFQHPWNEFTPGGVLAWLLSIGFLVAAFAPARFASPRLPEQVPFAGLRRAFDRLGDWKPRLSWHAVALLAILAVTAYFRLYDISVTPREMTSDHVEMLLDAERVERGEYNIFFANNGGREALQFYLLAGFAQLPRQSLNLDTLVLLNAIESILTIPILYWFGREMVGPRYRTLGIWAGLLLAAFAGVSVWAQSFGRMGERIVLTPGVVALVMIFFVRGLRSGRRWDFIFAGLTLGFGLYTYQAARMIPVVIAAGIGLALVFKPRWATRPGLIAELAIIAALTFVIFVPLLSYSTHYPEEFWRRSSGRILGDSLTQETDENGNIVYREPTTAEQLQALQANIPTLFSNIRNALLMYHWRGDVIFLQNPPNRPAFDPLTGGLLMVGVGAWGAWMLRRSNGRIDAARWLVPVGAFILIFPSALALAFPGENPSATRMSGTLPFVYLLAAFPLALIIRSLVRLLGGFGRVLAVVGSAGIVAGALAYVWPIYFDEYDRSFINSALPYSDVGAEMARLNRDDGIPFGNIFILSYPNWWDHRAVGIEAGAINWPNSIVTLPDAPAFVRDAAVRGDQWRTDVDRDLIFLYNVEDAEAESWLRTMFPDGTMQQMTTYQPEDRYNLYRVPALGQAGFDEFLARSGAVQAASG